MRFIVNQFKKDSCTETGVCWDIHADTIEKAVEQTQYDVSQIQKAETTLGPTKLVVYCGNYGHTVVPAHARR